MLIYANETRSKVVDLIFLLWLRQLVISSLKWISEMDPIRLNFPVCQNGFSNWNEADIFPLSILIYLFIYLPMSVCVLKLKKTHRDINLN